METLTAHNITCHINFQVLGNLNRQINTFGVHAQRPAFDLWYISHINKLGNSLTCFLILKFILLIIY